MAKQNPKTRRKRRFYKRKGVWVFLLLCLTAAIVALRIANERLEPYKQQAAAIDISTIDDVELSLIHI